MGKGVATIVIVLVLAAILIISVATFSPPEQASGTVQGSIFDRFLCLRYPSCPSGYVVNPASCRCVPRTTTTTTTTTATLTCACPSGYTPYQGYCAPNCFFETIQPPCTAAFIPCVRTTTTTTPICKCPDGYVQQGNNCISGPCYTLPCGSLAPINILPCPTTTTTTTTTTQTTRICPQYIPPYCPDGTLIGGGIYTNGCPFPSTCCGNDICSGQENYSNCPKDCTTTTTTSTTTTTTATVTCSCPSGYTKYGNVCAPNCYFNNPPCMIPVLTCS